MNKMIDAHDDIRAFLVAWCYHSPYAPDFGICNTPLMTKKEAETYLVAKASIEFNEYCTSGYEPNMAHDPDYAKVECEKGGDKYWEFKIQQVGKED